VCVSSKERGGLMCIGLPWNQIPGKNSVKIVMS
jgi:hypothetical protein